MTDLRKLAKGQVCQVNLHPVCCWDQETTVLAHYRISGLSGMGYKAPDLFGSWACHTCHDAVDNRTQPELTFLSRFIDPKMVGMDKLTPEELQALEDRVRALITTREIRISHLNGVLQTQSELVKMGYLKW